MKNLKPCKICGKSPRVKMEHIPTGCGCTIYCKPWLRKARRVVTRWAALEERAYEMAVSDWNEDVER